MAKATTRPTIFKAFSYPIDKSQLTCLTGKWDILQKKANGSVFVDWFWIKQWLGIKSTKKNNCICIEVKLEDVTVGLALFGVKTTNIFWGLQINQYFLHKSGDVKEDQIWIEHNTFLLHKKYEQQAMGAICQELVNMKQVDDIKIGMSSPDFVNKLELLNFNLRTELSSVGYKAVLDGFMNIDDYLNSLSKNTRSSIKRSLKLLKQQSPLDLSLAEGDEKSVVLAKIAQLHREKWRSTVYGSGFDNPNFYQFHKGVIEQDQTGKNCRLYTLYQNGSALGYVYLLTKGDTWSFYLSALNFNEDNRIKVGLVIHTLIIEQAIKEGMSVYDFLAGEAQYKNSLSNTQPYEQKMFSFYRRKPVLLARESLRKLKRAVFGSLFSSLRMKLND